jgi:hypothetical protein
MASHSGLLPILLGSDPLITLDACYCYALLEIGKMLLQVQWAPRDAGEPEPVVLDVLFLSNA